MSRRKLRLTQEQWDRLQAAPKPRCPRWIGAEARAMTQCDKYAAQFGVGASYRAKLAIGGEEKEDEFSAWKKGVKK